MRTAVVEKANAPPPAPAAHYLLTFEFGGVVTCRSARSVNDAIALDTAAVELHAILPAAWSGRVTVSRLELEEHLVEIGSWSFDPKSGLKCALAADYGPAGSLFDGRSLSPHPVRATRPPAPPRSAGVQNRRYPL